MTAATADLPLFARTLLALTAVLALLLAARWVVARQGLVGMAVAGRGGLQVAETLVLDARNRLMVIRRGETEMVLAIGPHGITKLEFPLVPERAGHP